jgi:hypothetical protein
MAHARRQHPNAVLTPTGRACMVVCVLDHGWTIEATVERFQIDTTASISEPEPGPAQAGVVSAPHPPVGRRSDRSRGRSRRVDGPVDSAR